MSRRPPAPSFRSGSSISATGPGLHPPPIRGIRESLAARAACAGAPGRAPCATSSSTSSSSPATARASRNAVRASRSSSASASDSFTVRMPCPVTKPASQSGYQSCSASGPTSCRLRPRASWSSSTSMSEPGHNSPRAVRAEGHERARHPWPRLLEQLAERSCRAPPRGLRRTHRPARSRRRAVQCGRPATTP